MGNMVDQAMVDKVKSYILKDCEGRREICSVYKDKDLLKEMIAYLADAYRDQIDYVAAPESLGFILGGILAAELGVGFIPIRNGGWAVLGDDAARAVYVDHRDHARSLQVRTDDAFKGAKILIVDDWIETAATIQASISILEEMQAKLAGIACIGVEENEATEKMIKDGTIRYIIKK